VTAVGLLVCLAASDLPLFLIGRTLTGLCGACFPLAFALARRHLPEQRVAPGIGALLLAVWLVALLLAASQGSVWGRSSTPVLACAVLKALGIGGACDDERPPRV
jgi:predicted MFS family arabinose efflux permease